MPSGTSRAGKTPKHLICGKLLDVLVAVVKKNSYHLLDVSPRRLSEVVKTALNDDVLPMDSAKDVDCSLLEVDDHRSWINAYVKFVTLAGHGDQHLLVQSLEDPKIITLEISLHINVVLFVSVLAN